MKADKRSGWVQLTEDEAGRLRAQLEELGGRQAEAHFALTITALGRAASRMTIQHGTATLIREGLGAR